MKRLVSTLATFCLLAFQSASADTPTLFEHLRQLDGKSFSGRMSFPADSDHEMNKPMKMTVKVVSDDEIRVPFQVGEDRSRTWILTRSEAGILLKHDHRHADGTPDEVTNYGGLDSRQQLGTQLIFPADQDTIDLLPEAATNTWSFRLSPDRSRLYYYLERHKQSRFEAEFELTPNP